MEVPADKPAAGGAGDVFFVLEKATLEVAKVGKARVCRGLLRRSTATADALTDNLHPSPPCAGVRHPELRRPQELPHEAQQGPGGLQA